MTQDDLEDLPEDSNHQYCKLFWDYYGPSAEGTARHFRHHLEEWIDREGHRESVRETGLEKNSNSHFSVVCLVKLLSGEIIYRALRAHRAIKVAL